MPIYCIDLLKNFLDEDFELTQEDIASLNDITKGPIDRIQTTCNYNLICEGKEPTGNILKFPEAIRTRIQQYITNPFLIDKTFEYLREHYIEIYKKITGPSTWERRMDKITKLLNNYIGKIIEQIPNSVPIFWFLNINLIEQENAAEITKLYLFLIKNIIENNTDNKYYTIIHPSDDFSRPHYSIMPQNTDDGNTLKKLLYSLIKELHRIVYIRKTEDEMESFYISRSVNRSTTSFELVEHSTLINSIFAKLFRVDTSKEGWEDYDYFMNYISYEGHGIFYQPMS